MSPRSAAGRSVSSAPTAAPRHAKFAKANCPPTRSSAAITATTCRRKSTNSRARSRRRSRRGPPAQAVFARAKAVHIAACGTSYHAGLAASYFLEQICRIPARIEYASEYRYRKPVVTADTLFVTISQSGETADTLAALPAARQSGYLSTLTICNVAESSMVRESDLVLLTRAGPEIGVASTKAFTTQLTALALLVVAIAKHRGITESRERELVGELLHLPALVEKTLQLDPLVQRLAEKFADKHH